MSSGIGIAGFSWSELLVAAGLILIVIEIISPAFFFLGFAIGSFAAAGAVSLFNPSLPIVLLVFSLISAGSFLVLRKVFRKHGDTHVGENDINRY
jgi:inner membrane protein